MHTTAVLDKSIQKELKTLHDSILAAKIDLARSWFVFASSLKLLKEKMDTVGDRKTNWRGYLGVESFEEYCEEKLEISTATGYGLIASYTKLLTEKPEFATNTKLIPPSETKVRILGNKKLKVLQKDAPDHYAEIKEMIFNEESSRREIESKLDHAYDNLLYDEDENNDESFMDSDPLKEELAQYWNSNKNTILHAVKENNQTDLCGLLSGIYNLGNKGENSTRVENTQIKRLIMEPSALSDSSTEYTNQVISRAKLINPHIELIYPSANNDKDNYRFPDQLTGAGNYWFMKESLIIRERKSSFIETFPSPGEIVENLNTAVKLGMNCRSACQYCYQQASPYVHQDIFSNLDDLIPELEVENYVHKAILTIWSIISHLKEERFNKIPHHLQVAGNKLRIAFQKEQINSKAKAVKYLTANIPTILDEKKLELKYDPDKLKSLVKDIPAYYTKNKSIQLWLWVSEYHDILAIDPIAKQIEFLMTKVLPKVPVIGFMITTKSVHADDLLKYDGADRIMVNMGLNPEAVIDKYETGTANLDQRLELIKKLQDKGGYKIRLSFEPMLIFSGWQKEYRNLVTDISKKINMRGLDGIVLGSIRLRSRLKSRIMRNYPWTDLFSEDMEYETATKGDKRERYTEKIRIEQYKLMIEELRKHTDTEIILGAEYPEMWGWVGLDREKFITETVYT